jgi:phage baseplate assembly protein W
MADQQSFLGTGWSFPPNFERGSHRVSTTSDVEDIRCSLQILLNTEVGERILQPRYGCNLRQLLFEPLDTSMQVYVQELVNTAILYFEPRVVLENVLLEANANEARIDLRVLCTIAATNTRANFVYPFYKEEGTEVGR